MENAKIHEFNNGIYPQPLWVCLTFRSLSERFDNTESLPVHIVASTDEVQERDTYRNGILIRFGSKADMTMSSVAHEAYHATKDMFHYVGATDDYEHQEAFAYLLSWVVNCLEKVKTNKAK